MRPTADANRAGAFSNSWAMCPIMMRSSTIPVGLFQRIPRFPVFLAAHYNSFLQVAKTLWHFEGSLKKGSRITPYDQQDPFTLGCFVHLG
jgi:hypothetical protein